ncbi:hypothetical protein MRX96_029688 [Rhipicephalus microplus]
MVLRTRDTLAWLDRDVDGDQSRWNHASPRLTFEIGVRGAASQARSYHLSGAVDSPSRPVFYRRRLCHRVCQARRGTMVAPGRGQRKQPLLQAVATWTAYQGSITDGPLKYESE